MLIVTVKKLNKNFIVYDETGIVIDHVKEEIPDWMLKKASSQNVKLQKTLTKRGIEWRRVKEKKENKKDSSSIRAKQLSDEKVVITK